MLVSRQVVAFATLSVLSISCADGDDDSGAPTEDCVALTGPFMTMTIVGPPCDSPVNLCTHGMLQGELAANYDFTFRTLDPANDPADPTKMVYTGTSVVTALDGSGVIKTEDTGVLHNTTDGSPAPFATKAIATTATGRFERSV